MGTLSRFLQTMPKRKIRRLSATRWPAIDLHLPIPDHLTDELNLVGDDTGMGGKINGGAYVHLYNRNLRHVYAVGSLRVKKPLAVMRRFLGNALMAETPEAERTWQPVAQSSDLEYHMYHPQHIIASSSDVAQQLLRAQTAEQDDLSRLCWLGYFNNRRPSGLTVCIGREETT